MNATLISDTTTHGIRVGAAAFYLADPSAPDENKYVYGYRIVILNAGEQSVQLLRRHWDIIDAEGENRSVDGDGVVGEQPELDPGEAFKYESFAVLPTPWGTMEGYYEMQDEAGEPLRVAIGRFFLTQDSAASLTTSHKGDA